jgi:crossover junction endodeoxyribonuclease RuvC
VVRLARSNSLPVRLAELQREFERLIRQLEPTSAAVEAPFHGINARSALQLAHARGVILAALARAGVEISEYTPATVKKSVAGSGKADKLEVSRTTVWILGSEASGQPADVTDALAVALCHLSMQGPLTRAVAPARGRKLRKPEAGSR